MSFPWMILALAATMSADAPVTGDEKIAPIDRANARSRTIAALEASGIVLEPIADEVERLWSSDEPAIAAIALSLSAGHEPAREAIQTVVPSRYQRWTLPAVLQDSSVDPFLRSNLAVALAQRLVQSEHFDEAVVVLQCADPLEVVDPATYQFLTAVCNFHLGERGATLDALAQLQRMESVPERYHAMAAMMLLSMQQMEPESLSSIAQEMRDVRRRLDLGKTDKQVQELEDNVLNQLDTMIAELEKQKEEQQQSSNQLQPNSPAPESQPLGGEGEGNVDPKDFTKRSAWGNLPAKEREKALQEIGRDLPGHYRDAVEQYFRRLAEMPDRKQP